LNGTVTKPQVGAFRGLGAGVYKYKKYSVGGDVEFEQDKGVTRFSGKVQIDRDESAFCLFMNDLRIPKKKLEEPKTDVVFGLFSKIKSDLSGALDFKVDNKLDTEMRLGSDYKVDQSTNFKSRLTVNRKDLRIGLVYKQKLTPSTKITVSSDLNTRSFLGTVENSRNDHRFNFTYSTGDD